jgi:methylenetetrahydrofolate dehydrogenase (NADP+)/methenyltetrahydrofolate cyclohydrolase
MSAQILDGRVLAKRIKDQLKAEVEELKRITDGVPHLINIMLGDDAGSCAYANSQKRIAEQIGIRYDLVQLERNTSQEKLADYIKKLNADSSVHGIMLHKPVPAHIDYHKAVNGFNTDKDLEGVNVENVGKILLGATKMIPCTPASVMEHIHSTGVSLRGKEVVVIGASDIVGKPLSLLLLRQWATVTICHIATFEAGRLLEHITRADILIVAVGKPNLIKGEWVKPGTIVIDVGINQVGDQIIGDVEFEAAAQRAAFITPVPGGVGPVTVVMLMRNGIEAYRRQLLS